MTTTTTFWILWPELLSLEWFDQLPKLLITCYRGKERGRERIRVRRSMIETIRMNDGKLDMVETESGGEFVWSLVVISEKNKEENFRLCWTSKQAKANDDEQRLKRERSEKTRARQINPNVIYQHHSPVTQIGYFECFSVRRKRNRKRKKESVLWNISDWLARTHTKKGSQYLCACVWCEGVNRTVTNA